MDTLLVDRSDGVVTVTLDRPEKKNAINTRMWAELTQVFGEVAASAEDRVLVVTGSGDGFCSGADLTDPDAAGDMTEPGIGGAVRSMRRVGRCALALHQIPQPVIAAVNGVAAGAGANLALGCDLVVASDRARFIEIFSRRGLVVDFGGSWVLPRLVGLHRAKELVFLGDPVDAHEAERIGLVNRVVPAAQLAAAVRDLAVRLAAGPPIQLAVSKRLLNQSSKVSMAEALEFEDIAQALMFSSHDTAEAVLAFVERREPRFTGE